MITKPNSLFNRGGDLENKYRVFVEKMKEVTGEFQEEEDLQPQLPNRQMANDSTLTADGQSRKAKASQMCHFEVPEPASPLQNGG